MSETEIRSRKITGSQDTNNPKLWYHDKLVRIVIEMNKEVNKIRERCYNAKEEENVSMYYSLLTFPALLHSFYMS